MANRPTAPKPSWEFHARPIGAAEQQWEVMSIEARSALQAEAILRRQGYEVIPETAMSPDAPPASITPGILKPLHCDSCGYPLAGLTIDRATVTCPECSYPQALLVWSEREPGIIDANHPLIGILAMVGIATIGLVGFAIVMALLSP